MIVNYYHVGAAYLGYHLSRTDLGVGHILGVPQRELNDKVLVDSALLHAVIDSRHIEREGLALLAQEEQVLLPAAPEVMVEAVEHVVHTGEELLYLGLHLALENRGLGHAGQSLVGIGVGLRVIDQYLELGVLGVLVHHERDGVHALVGQIVEVAAVRGQYLGPALKAGYGHGGDVLSGVYLVRAVADTAVEAVVGDVDGEGHLDSVLGYSPELGLDLAELIG